MSNCEAKYTTTEAILNQEWPKINGKFKLSFRSHKFIVKTHDAKESDNFLKFTIKSQKESLFFKSKYDIFFVLTICNENDSKSIRLIQKVPKPDDDFLTEKLKFTIPVNFSEITSNESGFLKDGKISLKFYFYLLIDDDEDSNEPIEEFVEGWYINEKCWKIPHFSSLQDYKSSDFTFHQNSFHFEYTKKDDENEPLELSFVCDKIDLTDNSIKFQFMLLNLGGYPTLTVKKEWKDIKENEKIIVNFEKSANFIFDKKNGFNSTDSLYVSIHSKTEKYKSSESTATATVVVNRSKEETGYVGLINQGATCYMNSMLQCLFHLGCFRKLVYMITTTGEENPKNSIPLNLQRLFGQLQLSSEPCSTEALTVSFGWDFSRTIIQHDTQEFCRVLLGNLEEKLKKNNSDNKDLENGISKIFMGKFKSFIRCVNVDFESSRVESFYDLTMDVEGCNNLEESFKKYIETEKMDGENQYNTDDPKYGKQDALMGTEFIEFPPVLQLHLSRFKYDYYTDRMVKINDRFEFPEEINLSKFIATNNDATNNDDNIYDLYGVLVHSGTVSVGHYYAFLRTSTDPQWFEFNDSYVTKVDKSTAIENNFGGSSSSSGSYYSYQKSFSAYILVYVRRKDIDWIFQSIKDDEIPEHVRKFIEHPELFTYKEEEGKEEEEKEIKLNVTLDDSISYNLLTGKTGFINPKFTKEVTVSSKDLRGVIYQKVAEAFNLNIDEIRLWTVYSKVPSYLFNRNDMKPYFSTSSPNNMFIQHKDASEEVNLNYNQINAYLKFYCPEFSPSTPLQYIGSFIFDSKDNAEVLIQKVNSILGLPEDTKYDIFIESQNGESKTIKIDSNLKEAGISNGSSLIFQISKESDNSNLKPTFQFKTKMEEESKSKEENDNDNYPVYSFTSKVESPIDYLNSLNSQNITIPLFDYYYIYKPVCYISVPLSTDFSSLKEFIVKSLSLDYDKTNDILDIYKKYYTHSYPGSSKVNDEIPQKLKTVFQMAKEGDDFNMYYKFIKGTTADQLKEKVVIKIHLSEDSIHVTKSFFIILEKKMKYELNEIVSKINEGANLNVPPNKLRIYSIGFKKVGKIINEKTYLGSSLNWLRVDIIPEDQLNVSKSEAVVRFFFSNPDVNQDVIITAEAFALKVNVNEKIAQVKERIQKIYNIDDDRMKKTNFFVGEDNVKMVNKNALNDESSFINFKSENNVFIVQQIKKSKSSSSNRRKEEALKIDN